MERARYINPTHNKVLPKGTITNPKILCVVTFFVPRNRIKNYGYFSENKEETIKRTVTAHKTFKPGVEYDLLLVNNGTEDEEILKWLPNYETRENQGYGFGAWKYAWDKYKDYDFYLFTEDDIMPSKHGWLKEILDLYNEENDTGAVGQFIEARSSTENGSSYFWSWLGLTRDSIYNFDGAFTFTSKQVLKQVDETGGLKVLDCGGETGVWPTVNEVGFQQPILELGYELRSFADGKHKLAHGSEIFTGDVRYCEGELSPLINANGRHKVDFIKEVTDQITW